MRNLYLFLLAAFLCVINTNAQTTINTTVGSSGYTGTNSASNFITFVVENTSGGDVLLTTVGNWTTTSHNNTTSTLWYSSTSLSGSVTLSSPTWTSIASNVVSGITSTGVNTVISGMSFLIPNNAVYRFALQTTGTNYYSGSGSTCPTPTIFTASGITLKVCNQQINGSNVGYGGTNTPRAFTGSITFVPACTSVASVTASGVTASAATLTWPAVTGSQGYEYALTTSATPPTGAGTAISGTTYNASSLTQATTYYMHVRNKCNATSFSGWTTTSFTTLTSCFPVTAVSVSNLVATAGVLSWSPGASSAGYEWVINQTAGNPAGNGTAISTTSTPFSGLTSGATYWAHVRNVCGGGDKSSWMHFQFTMPVCNKPTNMLISNVSDSTADLLWSQMPSANGYEYAVNFSSLPPTSGTQTTTNIAVNLTDLVPNSKYYVHVRSRCFVSDASAWKLDSFITKMVCYAPIVQVNALGTNTPYAFWDAVPTAIAYEYALTNTPKEPAFGTTIYVAYADLELPEDGKDYYLHVRSKCNSMFTFSQWSTVALRTGTTNINVVTTQQPEIYPNPASDVLFVKNARTGTGYSVIDMAGRVLISDVISQNDHQIDVSNLPSGIYLIKLNDGLSTQSRFLKQ